LRAIEKGANLDLKTSNGLTPLHIAARVQINSDYLTQKENNLNILVLLAKNKANISSKDEKNREPLHLAAQVFISGL
jgi:ankyrin repeat protein